MEGELGLCELCEVDDEKKVVQHVAWVNLHSHKRSKAGKGNKDDDRMRKSKDWGRERGCASAGSAAHTRTHPHQHPDPHIPTRPSRALSSLSRYGTWGAAARDSLRYWPIRASPSFSPSATCRQEKKQERANGETRREIAVCRNDEMQVNIESSNAVMKCVPGTSVSAKPTHLQKWTWPPRCLRLTLVVFSVLCLASSVLLKRPRSRHATVRRTCVT